MRETGLAPPPARPAKFPNPSKMQEKFCLIRSPRLCRQRRQPCRAGVPEQIRAHRRNTRRHREMSAFSGFCSRAVPASGVGASCECYLPGLPGSRRRAEPPPRIGRQVGLAAAGLMARKVLQTAPAGRPDPGQRSYRAVTLNSGQLVLRGAERTGTALPASTYRSIQRPSPAKCRARHPGGRAPAGPPNYRSSGAPSPSPWERRIATLAEREGPPAPCTGQGRLWQPSRCAMRRALCRCLAGLPPSRPRALVFEKPPVIRCHVGPSGRFQLLQ